MDERTRRIGLNEAAFRAVNEQIESLSKRFAMRSETLEFVCECGHADCAERVRVGVDAYERVRSDGRDFVIVPGHEIPDTEDVIDEADGYYVVRKKDGGPADLAIETDVST